LIDSPSFLRQSSKNWEAKTEQQVLEDDAESFSFGASVELQSNSQN